MVLIFGFSGCSVESIESEDVNSIDAKGNVNNLVAESVLTFSPKESCIGELVEYCLTFPQATAGPNNKETQVLIDLKVIGDDPNTEETEEFYYVDIFRGKGNTMACFDYIFDLGTNEIRYKTAGTLGTEWIEDTITISSCVEVCSYGKGYWTNHGPVNPGNQEDMYPEGGIILGDTPYELYELQEILQVTGNTGAVFKMKQHLITVLLNIANGVDGSTMTDVINEANAIIVLDGEGYSSAQIENVKDALEAFNISNSCEETE